MQKKKKKRVVEDSSFMLILACNRTSKDVEMLELASNDNFVITFWISKLNCGLLQFLSFELCSSVLPRSPFFFLLVFIYNILFAKTEKWKGK